MNCREFEFDLDEYAIGRLAPERRKHLDAHRASCAACENAYQQETGLRTQLRDLPIVVPAHDLWNQVATQISQPVISVRSVWKRWTAMALIPAASFGLLAFFLMPRTPQFVSFPDPPAVTVMQVSHEEKVVDNLLDMRRKDTADRDGLIELTSLER